MKSKINKADSQCHPHKIHNLPLKPFTAVKVKPKHSVFYLLQCLKYEPGSLTRARVRRIYLLSCQSFSQLLLLYSFLFHLSILFFTFYFRVVTVQPCAGLNEKVCCKLACISNFSSKPAYGEPTMLLVFMNMETRRCHGWTVTAFDQAAAESIWFCHSRNLI